MSSTSTRIEDPQQPTSDDLEVIVSNISADIWTRLQAAPPVARALFGLVPTLAIFFLFFLLSRSAINVSQLLFVTGLVCLSVGGTVIARLRLAKERTILAGFAQANGYTFDEHGAVDQAYGTLFRVTDDGEASDVVTGTYRGHTLRLFAYTLTVGSGRSSHTYQDTVLELDLGGKLPPLLLLNKRARFGGINLEFGDGDLGLETDLNLSNQVSLEGDFNEHFTLFSQSGQVAAREVFTPDLMQLLEDSFRQFSVELAGSRVYIYAQGLLQNPADLTAIFTLAKRLATILEPVSSRFATDPSIPKPTPNTASNIEPVKAKPNPTIMWIMILLGLSPAIALAIGLAFVH